MPKIPREQHDTWNGPGFPPEIVAEFRLAYLRDTGEVITLEETELMMGGFLELLRLLMRPVREDDLEAWLAGLPADAAARVRASYRPVEPRRAELLEAERQQRLRGRNGRDGAANP